ncbi:hypothetical protein EVAR_51658_1 [Eumeta japonica]|uniref:Uncharacterized protein n=1 Tax=Eumeta variegata TaxID=151549 RepID=A0A4C1YDZ3_EUMVA|nr:hypothetical protein EVAR_51658_1 [Eumeta japonica]
MMQCYAKLSPKREPEDVPYESEALPLRRLELPAPPAKEFRAPVLLASSHAALAAPPHSVIQCMRPPPPPPPAAPVPRLHKPPPFEEPSSSIPDLASTDGNWIRVYLVNDIYVTFRVVTTVPVDTVTHIVIHAINVVTLTQFPRDLPQPWRGERNLDKYRRLLAATPPQSSFPAPRSPTALPPARPPAPTPARNLDCDRSQFTAAYFRNTCHYIQEEGAHTSGAGVQCRGERAAGTEQEAPAALTRNHDSSTAPLCGQRTAADSETTARVRGQVEELDPFGHN